jgi:hypothetical protein
MPIAAALTAFCDMLRTSTGRPVALGRPEDTALSLFVWPWRVEERPDVKLPAPRLRPGSHDARRMPALQIHVLVFARPALAFDGLEMLSQARRAIADTPVVDVAPGQLQCLAETLPVEQLAAVLQAADIELTLCLSVVLRTE